MGTIKILDDRRPLPSPIDARLMSIKLREHQVRTIEAALVSECSGLLSLPPAAGKTVIACMIATQRGGSALIFCNTVEVVLQFVQQIERFCIAPNHTVMTLTAASKRLIRPDATNTIMITTYAMMSSVVNRSEGTCRCIDSIHRFHWDTIILDEVHWAAAEETSRLWTKIKCNKMFGLTATLVRADKGINSLLRDIGPVLIEVPWRSLEEAGYTARVEPVVVYCDLPHIDTSLHTFLLVINPSKVSACDAIRRKHADDNIIIFCDKLWACELLAVRYMCPFLTGDTPDVERFEMLSAFRLGTYKTIVLSRVGDTGWDMDASIGIVIDAHFGSERQEAQRVGRIMRPNARGGHSIFYDLVTNIDAHVKCFWRRQRFLHNLGYVFDERSSTQFGPEMDADSKELLLGEIERMRIMLQNVSIEKTKRAAAKQDREERQRKRHTIAKMHPLFKKRAQQRLQSSKQEVPSSANDENARKP